ncbi:MAG: DUF3800 domain-containing protein [Actinomycetota bacterium]|nr:DUF3800 domain-containing protein [Actinomycetota bacterium]MDQ3954454.1 DUF3800 domain-containing protein [Actinomycetota bacterium]
MVSELMRSPMRYVAYADESTWNKGRYRAVAAVSLPKAAESELVLTVGRLLADAGVSEFGWKKLRDARRRDLATEILDLVFCSLDRLRVNVLLWDTHDSRHAHQGRDDIANLERMYYWIFTKMAAGRHGVWTLRPDEQSALNWDELHDVLTNAARRSNRLSHCFADLSDRIEIERLSPCRSHENPLVQVADLFAGMAVYSWSSFDKFTYWSTSHQPSLLALDAPALSGSDRYRCEVLDHFDRSCKKASLQVSLKSSRGLRSRSPRSPINIWPWTPQSVKDRAPLRNQRTG